MSLGLWLSRPRLMRMIFRPFLNRRATVQFPNGPKLRVDLADLRGPSFHIGHDYLHPWEAMASYEPRGRALVEESLRRKMGQNTDQPNSVPVFLDVGANIGLFSWWVKYRLPEVEIFAFEPHPVNAACLAETVAANAWEGLNLEPVALSEHNGSAHLFLDQTDAGGHSLVANTLHRNRGSTGRVAVDMKSLDAWATENKLSRLDFLKMDVQGAEASVLRGGKATLAKFRPELLVELQHDALDGPGSVLDAISDLGFLYTVATLEGERGDLAWLKGKARERLAAGVLHADYHFTPRA
jgi:FkbM family methyltransferase